MSTSEKEIFFSHQFAISCGTVSVDLHSSKILLIRSRVSGEHMLPKGRKDVGETLEETAKRETFEETGISVELRPVGIHTLATLPSSVEEPPELVTEPIAMTQRTTQGVRKIIFWYVANADCTLHPKEGTQQENESFDTIWADFGDVTSTLSFEDDRRIALAVIAAVRGGAS